MRVKLREEMQIEFSIQNGVLHILDGIKTPRRSQAAVRVAVTLAEDGIISRNEAIMRVEKGSAVANLSSKELKRDLLLFARQNPDLFLELANDDNVQLRNFGIRAVEEGIISLSSDQRYFMWSSTNRKIMTVPFDEAVRRGS